MTDINTKVTQIYKDLELLNEKKIELKKQFEALIVNKDISLDVRWGLFEKAPKDMKNCDRWIYHGLDDFLKGPGPYQNWFQHRDYERREEVDLFYLVEEALVEVVEGLDEGPSGEYWKWFKEYETWECFKDPNFLDKVKEQILKDNMGSFIFDW